jgi:hypothetical protein
MKALIGDRIAVRGRHVGDGGREGEVLEVLGPEGAPPYRVRWSDGHQDIFFPGADAFIEHATTQPARH